MGGVVVLTKGVTKGVSVRKRLHHLPFSVLTRGEEVPRIAK